MKKKIIITMFIFMFILLLVPSAFAEETTSTLTTSSYEGTHLISGLVDVFNNVIFIIYLFFAALVVSPVVGFGVVSLVYALLACQYKEGKDKATVLLKGIGGIVLGIGALYPLFYFNKSILGYFLILFFIGLLLIVISELISSKNLSIIVLGTFTLAFALFLGILIMASVIKGGSEYIIPLLPVIVAIPLAILNYMIVKKKRFN